VLDASLDAIITIDAKGCIVEFSWAAERIFGHRRCDVLGRDLASIIIPLRFREMHHAGLRRIVETGQGAILDRRMELTALHADGHEFPVDLTITAIPHNGQSLFTGFLRDITERKRAEREQQDARQQIQLLLDSVAEGIYGVDINQNCTFVNNAFLRILGYQDASEVIGKHIHSLIHHSHEDGRAYPASECRMYRASATNQTIHADNEVFWRKDGTSFPVEYWSHPIIKDGVSVGAVATFFDISKRKETEAQIRNLAFYDPLTMLPNRRLLIDRLQQALVTNARNKRQAALLFIDLDNFKVINDTRGHDTGDLLLIEAATRLQECVRQGDTIARLGGDEFVVLLEDLDSSESTAAACTELIAEKILLVLRQPYFFNEQEYHSTASIGITLLRGAVMTADEMLRRADVGLYQAKAAGRNTLCFFDPALQALAVARVSMESDLRQAISVNPLPGSDPSGQEQFLLYYQPQVDSSGRLNGAEALLRWRHPERGMVPPSNFIPLAESTGLILPIGHWVLATACQQLANWATRPEMAPLTIAVNVSARQFSLPNFVEEVSSLIDYFGINPEKLKLEITESMLLDNVDDMITKMTALKAKGINFSLDDFGTGYSSLSYLKRLPLYQLKIDQSFVRDILIDPNDAAIAQTIVELSKNMGLSVIAEGVETEGQRDFLEKHGCHHYQGFFFSRPLPIEEFEVFAQQD